MLNVMLNLMRTSQWYNILDLNVSVKLRTHTWLLAHIQTPVWVI